jgi:hypothetical protein
MRTHKGPFRLVFKCYRHELYMALRLGATPQSVQIQSHMSSSSFPFYRQCLHLTELVRVPVQLAQDIPAVQHVARWQIVATDHDDAQHDRDDLHHDFV